MATCQTANPNTHTHTRRPTRLMDVRTQIPDMPVHDTRRFACTAETLLLSFFSLPAVNMKVAAFNIQKFGKSKVAAPDVLEILVKVTQAHNSPMSSGVSGLKECWSRMHSPSFPIGFAVMSRGCQREAMSNQLLQCMPSFISI